VAVYRKPDARQSAADMLSELKKLLTFRHDVSPDNIWEYDIHPFLYDMLEDGESETIAGTGTYKIFNFSSTPLAQNLFQFRREPGLFKLPYRMVAVDMQDAIIGEVDYYFSIEAVRPFDSQALRAVGQTRA
jgi:hypothetical protein